MQYELSSEIEKVANKVIREHHPDLIHKKIHYLKLDKKDSDGMSVAKWSKGHQIAAEIKVLSGDAAFLISRESRSDDDGPTSVVVLKVYTLPWNNIKESRIREALIDSQLCRLVYDDETGKPSILEYDAKVHNSNVKRFGAWNREIEALFSATKDLPLFEENGKPKVESDVAVVKANGNGKVPTISIDTDRKCSKCGKKGAATDSGLCLDCGGGDAVMTEVVTKALEPLKEAVAKKRGRAAASARS